MGKVVRARLKRQDGTPWPFPSVLTYVSDRIVGASGEGRGLYLSAEEVRALDWAILRYEIGEDTTSFREMCFADHADASPQPQGQSHE